MLTETIRRLACPASGCAGPLELFESFPVVPSGADAAEIVEAVLGCTRCGSLYPVILGVAILETDLGSYLGAFWSEIEQCASRIPGAGISRRMQAHLGIPAVFTSQRGPNPIPATESHLEWTTAPYLQSHFDRSSLTEGLPKGWWQDAVERHQSESPDPYSCLMGIARERAHGRRIPGMAVEVGSSAGRGSLELAGCYEYSVGIDRSFGAVLTARRLLMGEPSPLESYSLETEKGRFEQQPLSRPTAPRNLDYVVASGGELPVAQSAARCVAALNVLCAVKDPLAMLDDFSRVLEPGGLVLISSPYWPDLDDTSTPSLGGPDLMRQALQDNYRIDTEVEMVPWILRLARRRWNVYLSHCIAATRL